MIYAFGFFICESGLKAEMTYRVPQTIGKTSSLSLPALLTAESRGPEEDKSICISARLNDSVSINLHTRDNSFVFKMAINCTNTDRASEI